MLVNSARVSLSKSTFHLCERDENLIGFLYRQSHWTPFAHPQLSLLLTHTAYSENAVKNSNSPLPNVPAHGSAYAHTSGMTAVNGSLWYWINNYKKYGPMAEDIARIIAVRFPTVAKEIGLPLEPCEYSSGVFEYKIMDEWVADDVDNRADMAMITLLVKAPIPIRTQCFKHKYGFVENEVSRRYVSDHPTWFEPKIWRKRAPGKKQGSLERGTSCQFLARLVSKLAYKVSDLAYRAMLSLDVCPEQARFLLAQGMETEWYWTMSLADFYRAYKLRNADDAQREVWELFNKAARQWQMKWPLSWEAISRSQK